MCNLPVSERRANASHTLCLRAVKDGAYFCYCAYVVRISEWSKKVAFVNGGAR